MDRCSVRRVTGRPIASRPLACAVLLTVLAGCANGPLNSDPTKQPGTWSPKDDNEANLRAMVADPHDLLVGKDARNSVAVEAAPPVVVLLNGKRPALPEQSSTNGVNGGGSGGTSGAGGVSGGGGNAGSQ